MFLSFIVAISSTMIGISVALAVVCWPFIIAALVRTIRIHQSPTTDERLPGLFATFCHSLVILVCFIVVSAVAIAVACCAGMLISLGMAGYFCRPFAIFLSAGCSYLSVFARRVWHHLRSPAFHAKVIAYFLMIREVAILATRWLVSACRTLWRRWWHPKQKYA